MSTASTYQAFREALMEGKESCVGTVTHFLTRIEQRKNLNIFLEVFAEEALQRAAAIDQKIKDGKAGLLAGMVIALKDNICYAGHKVSASSRILEGFESLYSATVVERLLAADAIIIGRTNCDEFAMGSSNENSAYGKVLNPLDESLVPGGSSGGSAAAVAAGLCHAALGSDTGGSIRQPASFCGVVGLRPTYGRISRYGLLAFASSMDQIGPITSSIEDAALLMEVMAGKDIYDATVSSEPVPDYRHLLHSADKKFKIAYLDDCVRQEGIDPEVTERFDELTQDLSNDGHKVKKDTFPYLDYVVPVYYVLATAEASSNLGRYSGMLYGYRSPQADSLDELIINSRSEGFGTEVKRRIMLGTFVLSEGYYDAYYTKAQKVRKIIRDYTEKLLTENDFLLLLTSPGTAFGLGKKAQDPIAMYLADIFTIQSALSGHPSISLPVWVNNNGMPLGLQVIGRRFDEARLLAFSKHILENYKQRVA